MLKLFRYWKRKEKELEYFSYTGGRKIQKKWDRVKI